MITIINKVSSSAIIQRSLPNQFRRSLSTSLPLAATSSTATDGGDGVRRTPLYQTHLEANGKMVNFENFLLPVQYQNQSINQSHLHTRNFASIFDVSHMLQTMFYGRDAVDCLESICTADIRALAADSGTLTVFTNENGGILDDLIVTKMNDRQLYVVSNAGRIDHDKTLMNETVAHFQQNGKDVRLEYLDCENQALLALQGPQSMAALQKLCNGIDLSKLYFMRSLSNVTIGSVRNCRITRCGYTGEDGFELSMAANAAPEIVDQLLALTDPLYKNERRNEEKSVNNDDDVPNRTKLNIKLAGLGARDTLRLEAGLCLYGSDLDETITPIEAGLQWLIAKRRRIESSSFPGSNIILNQIKNGCQRYRIGFRMVNGGPPARHGSEMSIAGGIHLGTVTSGCPSPCLSAIAGSPVNIGMGYINDVAYKTTAGKSIQLKIREKFYDGVITKMPFIPSKYYSNGKK